MPPKKSPKAQPVRLLVNLPPEEHDWLSQESYRREESMAEIVREAVAEYRSKSEPISKASAEFKKLLHKTAGTWEGEDGLEYQKKIRGEWDR